jgi:hypothetical protein
MPPTLHPTIPIAANHQIGIGKSGGKLISADITKGTTKNTPYIRQPVFQGP